VHQHEQRTCGLSPRRTDERKLDCLHRAGLNDTDAARYHRVFADVVLSYSAMDASLASLPPDVRDADLRAWQTDYLTLPPDRYPNIARVGPRFVRLDDPQNFLTGRLAVDHHTGHHGEGDGCVGQVVGIGAQGVEREGREVGRRSGGDRAGTAGGCGGEDSARVEGGDRPVGAEDDGDSGVAQVAAAPGPVGALVAEAGRPVVGVVGPGELAVRRLHARHHALPPDTRRLGAIRLWHLTHKAVSAESAGWDSAEHETHCPAKGTL
jgi:hypothetical protein